jgi:hypothetical protein
MSWLFSQALVEEFLGASCSDGEQSVQSSGNPTQLAYCAPDKMTALSRLSRFGMTYKPLTESRGEELLTLYRAAFPARTSALLEKETDLTERDQECGITWRAWLAKFDPDTSSWKTAQCSLLGEEPESLETLPRWGMTVDGLLWELPTLAPITKETGFGLWRTPQAQEGMRGTYESKEKMDGHLKRGHQLSLSNQVKHPHLWPTPTAHNAKEGGYPSEFSRNTPTLAAQAGGSLNPTWVEWLMGWPLGWTDLKPLVTDKSHCVQQQHGES